MVVVRSAPGGAEQKEPAPCVGHTGRWSGKVASRRSERYWARANSSVRSGPSRSGRAAESTIREPPVKTPSSAAPSSSRKERCSSVCPGGGQRAQRQPAQVHLVAFVEAGVPEVAVAGGGGQHGRARVVGQLNRAGEEVGVQVGVRGERHGEPAPLGRGAQRAQVPARVHGEGTAVAQIDEVGAVAEALVEQRYQAFVGEAHLGPPAFPVSCAAGRHVRRRIQHSMDLWSILIEYSIPWIRR
jgi:hypothetical protein